MATQRSNFEPIQGGKLTNTSLEALQDEEQRKIMDVVDKLRRTGLSSILQLPQLVVCGDQSSGKSSVLEAITEIPFPRKENLCTRFATEIVLRRDYNSSITTKITPDKNRPQHEQDELKSFSRSINDFSELPALIDEATALMGLEDVSSGGAGHETRARAFSRDVLSIEICGPTRPQLTLVDLPGLIHAASKAQSKHDVELIHSLVDDYISNDRTIILAVISAKNDYANQMILDKARKVDPEGNRTLGVITKPDTLRAGSENEGAWISLARNEDIFFKLGWHMLRNRVDGDLSASFKDRNESEAAFFSKGSYAALDRDMVGIESFRLRLSQTLTEHLKCELPGLRKELEDKLKDTQSQIHHLGESRATIAEQKRYLANIGQNAHSIFESAIRGHYSATFFDRVNTEIAIDEGANIKRLRAVIQYANIRFEKTMRLKGQKRSFQTSGDNADDEWNNTSNMEDGEIVDELTSPAQRRLSHDEIIQWIQDVRERTRGCELSGDINSMLISELFWEQSSGWEDVAWDHVQRVASLCEMFVAEVLQNVASRDVAYRLKSAHVDAALSAALMNAKSELSRIVADKCNILITYNHYYTTTIQKRRQEKSEKAMSSITKKRRVLNVGTRDEGKTEGFVPVSALTEFSNDLVQLDMDTFAAEDALDRLSAFYKTELKFFIDAVAKQVIERHLIRPLPHDVLSPVIIAGMPDDEISYIAAEPSDVSSKRKNLLAKEKMLLDGQATFKRAMGGR